MTNISKKCVCGSERIQNVSGGDTCMDCLERGVTLFGLRSRVHELSDRLAYAELGVESEKAEIYRTELVEAVTRMVALAEEIERVEEMRK